MFWWDTQVEKLQGARGIGKKVASPIRDATLLLQAGKDGLHDRQTIHRWRSNLNTPDAFELTFKRTCGRYVAILDFDTTAHVGQNKGETEWFTPAEYIEPARRVLGTIDLDLASTREANAVVEAARVYTRQDGGLVQPSHGRVWLNPPYAQPLLERFARKLADHFPSGRLV